MAKLKFSRETYLKWYKDMLLWRKFEDKTSALYIQQKIRGFLHLYNGQEAVLAGSIYAIDIKKDKMITAYRDHVQPIAMGVSPKYIMAELFGKSTGCSGGKGGSMHMFSKENNFYGGHGIVGGQIPLGAGIAFGDKYHGSDAVTLCYFGDGAARQGSLHETFNLAMLWKLPVIFICENNLYSVYSPLSVRQPNGRSINSLAKNSPSAESQKSNGARETNCSCNLEEYFFCNLKSSIHKLIP